MMKDSSSVAGPISSIHSRTVIRIDYSSSLKFVFAVLLLMVVNPGKNEPFVVAEHQDTAACPTSSGETCDVSPTDSPASIHYDACIDKDNECVDRNPYDCDSDPSWMLLNCPKTCSICVPELNHQGSIEQNAGLGKLPSQISIHVLQAIRQTNLYWRDQVRILPQYALVRSDCLDRKDMCAFWGVRGQCTNVEYTAYMERECPLTCRTCDSETWRGRIFLHFLLEELPRSYYQDAQVENRQQNIVVDRHRVLNLLLSKLGMSTLVLRKKISENDTNWIEELHRRLFASIPSSLLKLYPASDVDGQPLVDNQDFDALLSLHGVHEQEISAMDRSALLNQIMVPYRSRGFIVSIMQDFDHLITRPIQLGVGFGVPGEKAVATLRGESIVQMGAGTGYFAAILRKGGANVLAYDLHPPGSGENPFFDVSYIDDIQSGSCKDVFQNHPSLALSYSLLLVWPNDPDPVDNVQFCGGGGCDGSESVWDVDCLSCYIEAGGSKVIYVGEREANLSKLNPETSLDCGLSSTRRFQGILEEHFSLYKTVDIPKWWLNEDDLTIWSKKS